MSNTSNGHGKTMRDPLRYTLGTAAKATGKSKTTIQRAISNGRISAEKRDDGTYSIDPSELHRAFPHLEGDTVLRNTERDNPGLRDETPELRAKIEALEAMLSREREALDEARVDRDAWRQQARTLLAAPPPKPRKWWPW